MAINQRQKDHFKEQYLEWIKGLEVKDGGILLGFDDALWNLAGTILNKKPTIKEFITHSEVYWLLVTEPHRFWQQQEKKPNGKFIDILPLEEIEVIPKQFFSHIETLPHELFFYFKMPISLPENVREIQLTEKVHIVRLTEAESKRRPLKDMSPLAAALLSGSSPDDKEAYCKINVQGYGDFAEAQALSVFKRFMYMARLGGLFSSEVWDRKGERSFKDGFFKHETLSGNDFRRMTLPHEIANFVSGIKFDQNIFEGYTLPSERTAVSTLLGAADETYESFYIRKFKSGCRLFINLHDKSLISEPEHIFSAIEWGFDGEANGNETMGFIQICVGLEALLGEKGKGRHKNGLTERLADRCSYLLGKTPTERKKYADNFEDIYDLRSDLIHGTKPRVSDEHSELIFMARNLLRSLVYKEIYLNMTKN